MLRRLEDAGIDVVLRTDKNLAAEELSEVPECTALLVLWSQYFKGAPYEDKLTEISARASNDGAAVLNDVSNLIEMQDRRWLLRQLKAHNVPIPKYVECSRDDGQRPSMEEHGDYIMIDGQRINKPFVEKPVDRRDREIYVYFPKESGGGRALVSTTESGDLEYICRFDTAGAVRREGSFIYQDYLQSEGFIVQTICVAGLVYGNAVLSGIVGQSQSGVESAHSGRSGGQPCAVWLRQEEKVLASKLMEVFHQTLIGITFARSQTASSSDTSYVVDVWPGIPRGGLGFHRDDAVRALLAHLQSCCPHGIHSCGSLSNLDVPAAMIAPALSGRSASLPAGVLPVNSARGPSKPLASQYMPQRSHSLVNLLEAGLKDPDSNLLCVLLVARHGDRTPKQKVKVKVKLASEFAAGWLCGWLADTSEGPAFMSRTTFELRKPEQLARLASALVELRTGGYDVSTLLDALDCITKEGIACHAKVGSDGANLVMSLKWGGELTSVGIDEAEAMGWYFRCKSYPGEDIDELHATLRHDVKIYASKEMRCQQTAAAFSKGLLHLDCPLPPIIAAMVRTDEFRQEGNGDNKGKSYVEKAEGSSGSLLPADASWEELEALSGSGGTPARLLEFDSPRPALRVLMAQLEDFIKSLQEAGCCEPLHRGETHALLLERYRDALAELGPADAPRFGKALYALDHLQYDARHNRSALPPAALRALDEAVALSEALCDVAVPLEAALEQRAQTGGSASQTGRSILYKLRWDLRVASGADLGEDSGRSDKHEALYASTAGAAVRTRLYFGHNSWLQGLLAVLFGAVSRARPTTVEANSHLLATRLGFLANLIVRLWRRPTGELRVSCDFAQNGTEEPKELFELPFATVDSWWSDELRVHGEIRRQGTALY